MNLVFITGTHEQPFDRLVTAADRLAADGHDVFVQYGFASTKPSTANGAMWLGRDELANLCAQADVIVTHGGPGSILDAFSAAKVPIVVPRQAQYGEHVDDHQVAFGRHLERHRRVLLVEAVEDLPTAVSAFASSAARCVPPSAGAERHRLLLANALDRWVTEHTTRRLNRVKR